MAQVGTASDRDAVGSACPIVMIKSSFFRRLAVLFPLGSLFVHHFMGDDIQERVNTHIAFRFKKRPALKVSQKV